MQVGMFNKDGRETKRKFRVYCEHEDCDSYLIGKWGGGYGCITTKEGTFDWRNQVWKCDKHSKNTSFKDQRGMKNGKKE